MISIIDDDESVRASTRSLLRSAGFEVKSFDSAERFLKSGVLSDTDCLILDIRMPGLSGLELQHRLNAARSLIPIIFVTAHDDQVSRRLAIEAGAVDFFRKPFNGDALIKAIQMALKASVEV